MLAQFLALVALLAIYHSASADVRACVNASSRVVIAHRGASGYLPEHTLAAYRLAAQLGAQYVEPDVVLTKDGVAVALHDVLLDDTTDVADRAEFQARRWNFEVDGEAVSGFWAANFTLAELKTLRCRQRVVTRDGRFDGVFEVPTLGEIVEEVQGWREELGLDVGMYIEAKHSATHAELGLDVVGAIASALREKGLDLGDAAAAGCDAATGISQVIFQSFTWADILRLEADGAQVPLIYLTSDWDTLDLADIAAHAHGLGPDKELFDPSFRELSEQRVAKAHAHDLALHPWDFAIEPGSISAAFGGDPRAELDFFLCQLGVDGVFANFPDMAVHACTIAADAQEDGSDGNNRRRDLEISVGILGGLVLLLFLFLFFSLYRYVSGYRYFLATHAGFDDDEQEEIAMTRFLSTT